MDDHIERYENLKKLFNQNFYDILTCKDNNKYFTSPPINGAYAIGSVILTSGTSNNLCLYVSFIDRAGASIDDLHYCTDVWDPSFEL